MRPVMNVNDTSKNIEDENSNLNPLKKKMENLTKCPVCYSDKIQHKFALQERVYGLSGEEIHYSCCQNCTLIFQNPLLSSKELARYYPENYVAYSMRKDARNRMIYLLYNTYYSQKSNSLLRVAFQPVRQLLRFMPPKGAKLLDIGCGEGRFIKHARELGVDAHGIDPFIKNSIPELKIKKGDLLKASYPDEFFDYITLNNVLEHVPNPVAILSECKRILKQKGRIIVNIPNSSSLNYFLFHSNWISFDPPRHLLIFSYDSLKKIEINTGLRIHKIRHISEPYSLLASFEYLVNNLLNKPSILDRSKFIKNPLINILTLPYAILTNILHISDQIEVAFVK